MPRMVHRRAVPILCCLCSAILIATTSPPAAPAAPAAADAPPARPRPLMRDFMGLNVHTVQFKPDLYAPVCRRLRDYHPMDWDTGDDTSHPTSFPLAANGVDWGTMYGSWVKAGFDIDVCVMFDNLPPGKWKDPARDARAYGESFARFFGPSNAKQDVKPGAGGGAKPIASELVSSVEIGNEPSKYSQAEYRTIFQNMSRGLRAGDPKLTIATCAVMTGETDAWSKPVATLAGLEDSYDVLNVHSYPFKDKWPTWRRSYPEDPSIPFLKSIEDVARWHNEHARGKEVWLTEFGYDSSTKSPAPGGEWKQWVGVSDEQQARYIVRSFLVLSSLDLDRAYLYFFNDKDEPQLHGSSGITRDFKPKPSFYAMAHLYRTLGDYRFVRAVEKKEGELYCFEYETVRAPGKAPEQRERVYVAWSPTGTAAGAGSVAKRTLPVGGGVYRAERMAAGADGAGRVEWKPAAGGVEVEVGESPVYLWAR